jgi:hypothetical protein
MTQDGRSPQRRLPELPGLNCRTVAPGRPGLRARPPGARPVSSTGATSAVLNNSFRSVAQVQRRRIRRSSPRTGADHVPEATATTTDQPASHAAEAVDAGRGEEPSVCAPGLLIEGRYCDHVTAHELFRAGLITIAAAGMDGAMRRHPHNHQRTSGSRSRVTSPDVSHRWEESIDEETHRQAIGGRRR